MQKTVLITGASRGIGRAMAEAFAADGWQVAINYNSGRESALALASSLTAAGYVAQCFCADVAHSAQADRLAQDVLARFGSIDCLVCNAGIAQQKLFTDISDSDWAAMLATNLTGAFNVCRAVLPQMVSRKAGRIITISSVWGNVGASCEAHYSASKAGLIGLTKALAKEAGPSGITANCIAPGVIQTDMLAGFSADDLAQLEASTPLGRIGQPRDVAALAVFLASEAAGFITGQVIGVDGGFPL